MPSFDKFWRIQVENGNLIAMAAMRKQGAEMVQMADRGVEGKESTVFGKESDFFWVLHVKAGDIPSLLNAK